MYYLYNVEFLKDAVFGIKNKYTGPDTNTEKKGPNFKQASRESS